MEIVFLVLSWVIPILLVLLVASVPVSLVIEKVKKDWKGSEESRTYKIVQMVALGVWILATMILVALTFL